MGTSSVTPWAALAAIALGLGGAHTVFAQGDGERKHQSLYDRLGVCDLFKPALQRGAR